MIDDNKCFVIGCLGVNEEAYVGEYVFFRDFNHCLRFKKIEAIHDRFEIMDL
jgi:hypothetical protein